MRLGQDLDTCAGSTPLLKRPTLFKLGLLRSMPRASAPFSAQVEGPGPDMCSKEEFGGARLFVDPHLLMSVVRDCLTDHGSS